MCVMERLILSQCVQTLVRRSTEESSCGLKHIKVNLVPPGNGKFTVSARFGPEFHGFPVSW
jgi:hypothetical protein